MKKQGGRCICTGLHLMCIAQADSIGSYFILPLAWPSSQSHCFSMAKTTTVSHPDYTGTNDPIFTPRSTSNNQPVKQSIM